MSKNYAAGKHAFGFCDRCGFRYDLNSLKYEVVDERRNGYRVCDSCLNPDHPQLQLGEFRIYDPQSLLDPRPDQGEEASTGTFGWNPVGDGDTAGSEYTRSTGGTGVVGTVTVTTT
jgi:hypothetical protein